MDGFTTRGKYRRRRLISGDLGPGDSIRWRGPIDEGKEYPGPGRDAPH